MPANPYGLYPYFGPRNSTQPEPRPLTQFAVQSLSFNEIGGPRQATIKATGDQAALANTFDLLGCPIEIRNQRGEPVWWGRVVGVVAGNEGVSLDDMSNSIAIAYTTVDGSGASTSAKTGFAQDALSIAEYGEKQLLKTASSISADAAAKMQTSALAVKKYPPVKNDISARAEMISTLTCRGEWATLTWKYYATPSIGAVNWPGTGSYTVSDTQTASYKDEPETQTFQFGDASTSQYVRFSFKVPGTRPIKLKSLKFKGVKVGTRTDDLSLEFYGDNAGSPGTLMATVPMANATVPTGGHAWFDTSLDSGSNEIWVIPNTQYYCYVKPIGGVNVSSYYRLASNSALGYADGQSLVWNGSAWVATSPSGSPGVAGDILFELTAETSEPSFDLGGSTAHQRLAIPFVLGGSQNATAGTFQVEMERVGNPSSSITGYICVDSAGSPGAAVDYIAVACSSIPTSRTRITFTLPNNILKGPADALWLQLVAGWSVSNSDYIRVFTDPTNVYTGGATKAYNGAAWSAVSPVESMWFEVVGMLETTQQIKNIITSAGQFIAGGTEIETPSGIFTSPYQDGNRTAQAIIADLLALGTSSGGVLLASVALTNTTKEKRLRVYAASDGSDDLYNYFIDADNNLMTALNVLMDKTVDVTGNYVKRRDSLAGMSTNSYLTNATSYPAADAEYDVNSDYLKLVARGARDPFDVRVREG